MRASTTSGGSWIRPLRDSARRSQVHLVCFPFAGGSAGYFHSLARSLEPDISVLGVQYPGRQDRRHEPLVEDSGRPWSSAGMTPQRSRRRSGDVPVHRGQGGPLAGRRAP
ncbi:MAG TPA: thioesterase domain-containing protein [Pseudonocardiaceae bacterium]|nr:thioesterase domain-containing protein [Pseudonocardiaceae bacterium]